MADLIPPHPARRCPPPQGLFTPEQRAALLANGRQSAVGADIDPHPVVKLFTPDAHATWLLTELDPGEPDLGFGLCDLGLGFPELGYVSLSELRALRGPSPFKLRRRGAGRGAYHGVTAVGSADVVRPFWCEPCRLMISFRPALQNSPLRRSPSV